MSSILNQKAFDKILDEDIEALNSGLASHSLERKHIVDCLEWIRRHKWLADMGASVDDLKPLRARIAELEGERDEAVKVIGRGKATLAEMQACFQTIVDKYTSEGLPEPKPGETMLENICLTLEGWNRAEKAESQVVKLTGTLGTIKAGADHGVHGEVDMFDALEEIHGLAKAALTGGGK